MTCLFTNNAVSNLAGGLSPTTTTIVLASGSGIEFPQPVNPGDYFCATIWDAKTKSRFEIVYCTARSGDTLTVTRGQENTVLQGWSPGDIFTHGPTAGSLANFVQAGGPPQSSTSVIYVGTDSSTTINLINCRTNPIPATLTPGMQFNIKVANTNDGQVTAQLNGSAPMPVVRSDGSAMVGKELTTGQEMIFVYNGTALEAMYPGLTGVVLPPTSPTAPPTPTAPQRTIFYVDAAGSDNADGSTNILHYAYGTGYEIFNPTGPMATVQGVINKFKNGTYPAVTDVYIYLGLGVAVYPGAPPGTVPGSPQPVNSSFYGGFYDLTGFVGRWHIIGTTGQPGPGFPSGLPGGFFLTSPSAPPPSSGTPGYPPPSYVDPNIGCQAGGRAIFDLRNVYFQTDTMACKATSGGTVFLTNSYLSRNINITSPTYLLRAETVGKIFLYGPQYVKFNYGYAGIAIASGGQIVVGCNDPASNNFVPASFTFNDLDTAGYLFDIQNNATVTFNGTVTYTIQNGDATNNAPYTVVTGGGLILHGNTIPGTIVGIVTSPGWVSA